MRKVLGDRTKAKVGVAAARWVRETSYAIAARMMDAVWPSTNRACLPPTWVRSPDH